jgi:hypothetical protein
LLFHFGLRQSDLPETPLFNSLKKALDAFENQFNRSKHHFTGSYPPAQNGWHRNRRQIAIPVPRKAPCRSIASRAYSEHVGTKRQEGGNHGEITAL